jgi:hypothetical protein|uniref:Uncharacterized protein n=1 Tax=Zea mays TaxID=4577 RepID=C4J1R6_MAIZE|nr:unknown [Zea mays]
MAGQKSGPEFATQHKTHNLVLTSDVRLPLSLAFFFASARFNEVYRQLEALGDNNTLLCLAKNGFLTWCKVHPPMGDGRVAA